MCAIGLIAYFLNQTVIYGMMGLIGILAAILGHISFIVDVRRDRASGKRKYAENTPNCPPEFFHPKKSTSADIDANARYAAYDVHTARYIGEITPQLLAELIHAGEEWKEETNDIPIIPETIEALREKNASSDLLKFLRHAIGSEDSIELRWIKLKERHRQENKNNANNGVRQ
jgi:Ser-tRNA(Ala) deacylase AlaX